jgi:hypothetical protein
MPDLSNGKNSIFHLDWQLKKIDFLDYLTSLPYRWVEPVKTKKKYWRKSHIKVDAGIINSV